MGVGMTRDIPILHRVLAHPVGSGSITASRKTVERRTFISQIPCMKESFELTKPIH